MAANIEVEIVNIKAIANGFDVSNRYLINPSKIPSLIIENRTIAIIIPPPDSVDKFMSVYYLSIIWAMS